MGLRGVQEASKGIQGLFQGVSWQFHRILWSFRGVSGALLSRGFQVRYWGASNVLHKAPRTFQ